MFSDKSGCIRANVVVFEQSGCVMEKVVRNWEILLYAGKLFVFWQSGCFRAKVIEIGQKL